MDSLCDEFSFEHNPVPSSYKQLNMKDDIVDADRYDETLAFTSYAFDLSHTLLENQTKVTENKIIIALSHFDNIYEIVEKHFWKEQLARRQKGLIEEFSHLHVIKEEMKTMKSNYLHLLSDRDQSSQSHKDLL